MQSVTARLDKLPHWLVLLVTIFIGGTVTYWTAVPTSTLLGAFTTTAGAMALLKAGAVAGVVAVIAWLKTPPAGMASAKAKAAVAKVAASVVLVCLFAGTQAACLSSGPIVPVTPSNQAQVSACQSIATTHNDLVVGGFTLSGGTATLGTIAAIDTTPSDRTAFAISAAAVGAVAIVDTAWTALTSSEFASTQCSGVVGPLPLVKKATEPTTVTVTAHP